jgi:hypothetical protein
MTFWPDGKKFFFTILDDTDCSTLENVPPVYELLHRLGFRTTKTVWVADGEVRPDNQNILGTTCQDCDYLAWVKNLQQKGFEIAFHSATFSGSTRSQVIRGLENFKAFFGDYPKVLAQHNDTIGNESIYWGPKRVSGIARLLYRFIHRLYGEERDIYFGEVQDSKFFWGDICIEKIKYVRNFVYQNINTLRNDPLMPYYDARRPYVRNWFSASDAPDLKSFLKLLSKKNLARLFKEEGACLVYTHLGKGFYHDRGLDPDFVNVMECIAEQNGWFVPVGDLLDYILQKRGQRTISYWQRTLLEWKWLIYKLYSGTS